MPYCYSFLIEHQILDSNHIETDSIINAMLVVIPDLKYHKVLARACIGLTLIFRS